jgi:hypothetical protein
MSKSQRWNAIYGAMIARQVEDYIEKEGQPPINSIWLGFIKHAEFVANCTDELRFLEVERQYGTSR